MSEEYRSGEGRTVTFRWSILVANTQLGFGHVPARQPMESLELSPCSPNSTSSLLEAHDYVVG